MSMLAEPRQKRRYNLTPKGKPLFEDNDRFGTKMLEKMGWSKGKGLGKSEDGTQDFVRVKYKSDEKGLGFEDRDDQWTEHDKNFNGLLENLNGGRAADECPDDCEIITPTVGLGFATKSSNKKKLKDKISGQSLEEKSKKSKARVHYKKFTKGKDMSQYSETDLANIFGKKATPEDTNIYNQFQAFNAGGSDSPEKIEAKEECVQKEPEKSLTINTGVSVADYFKAKMAALKEKNGSTSSNPFNSNIRVINNVEVVVPSAKRKMSTDAEVPENEEGQVPKKKKKAKSVEVEESDLVNQTAEIQEEHIPRKKKKSKKQSIEGEELDSVPKIEESGIIENVTEEEAPQKKKKKKNVTELIDTKIDASKEEKLELNLDDGGANQNQPDQSNSEESICSKKKQSKNVREKNLTDGESTPLENGIPKKKNKRSEKNTIDVYDSEKTNNSSSIQEEPIQESRTQNIEEIPIQEEQNIETTKSKKKKNKIEVSSPQKDLTNLTNENNNNIPVDTYTISTYCAEKFRMLEPDKFKGSNLMDLNGYGLSTNLKLKIKTISTDAARMVKLWSGEFDKYTQLFTTKKKIYNNFMKKVKIARTTGGKRYMPALNSKSLKRKQVFQCV